MIGKSKSFHNSFDLLVRPYQYYVGGVWQAGVRDVDYLNRNLQYQFFSHFHPYVLQMVQRLNEGGIRALQDSDTLYLPQPNTGQPLTVLPNSTRASLTTAVNATRPDGTPVSLFAGTPLTLPNGVGVNIPNNAPVADVNGTAFNLAAAATVTLPGSLPAAFSSGIQWDIAGRSTIIPDYTAVTLPGGASGAVLSDDGSQVNLANGTAVSLRSGLPLPVFYDPAVFTATQYDPDSQNVLQPYPVKNLDFAFNGAYSLYNWELFFHAPLLVAIHLSQNQKFQDAQRWFHFIFNPADNSAGPTPERFWKVLPFQYTDVKMIEQILVNLSTVQDHPLYDQTVQSINDWKEHPFQPFAVAKFRPTAYMLKTVMAYLDNLIAWGDSLFQQYTIETINEATQLYVMAANILGRKPQAVPKKGTVKPLTYNDLRGKLDPFSNALVEMEADIPFDVAPPPGPSSSPEGAEILAGIGQTLYFCIPRNDKLLKYWDTVADRLFKIHNSLNLQGVFQRLPLYDPPIDPALLVRAAAAGLDVSAVVNGLNQPLPLVRFQLLVSKAVEICQEVKSLGANLLSAIEKQDNEAISLLRAQHESTILGLAETVKYSQWQEAIKARQGLEQSLDNAAQRFTYYQKLLGRQDADIKNSIPKADALDEGGLEALNFSQAADSAEVHMGFDAVTPDIAGDSTSVSDGEVKSISKHESEEFGKLEWGRNLTVTASGLESVGSGLGLIPQFNAHGQPMGVGATVGFGGVQLHAMMSGLAAIARIGSEEFAFEANKTAKIGSYSRRELDWTYQSNAAKGEINQIFKQLRGAQIREAIAKKEYENHKVQMRHAEEIMDFLQGNKVKGIQQIKETTIGFYAWMKREVKAMYSRAFQLAFEVARKAERAMQHELGDPDLSYIGFSYLGGIEGLLAGEKLLLDLKHMEMAWHDLNQREYELTKHVSLLQVAPLALAELRATGSCTVTLPEEIFDLDAPGHYFRRFKSLAVSIPSVTGPYTSLNCTVTLQSSSIRTSSQPGAGYARVGPDDSRFSDYYGSVQAIVTSSGQMDSGLFETNLRDERYLPFELSGVVSQLRLDLPTDVRQFDFDTISDVILHARYTAREGGEVLKSAAVKNLRDQIEKARTVGSVRLLSIRHEFPSEWAKFRSVTIGGSVQTSALSLTLLPQHYPFWARSVTGGIAIKAVEVMAEMPSGDATVTVNLFDHADMTGGNGSISRNPALGNLLMGNLIRRPAAITDATHPPLTVYFDNNSMKDLWVAITWGKA